MLTHRQSRAHLLPSFGLLCLALLLAACNASSKSTATSAQPTTTAGTPVAQTSPVATTPAGAQPTPVSGAFSVYVDPTFGYSFQYPSAWIVQPAVGFNESNVVISEPQPVQTVPDYTAHPLTQLLVRVTNDYTNSFVQKLLCNANLNPNDKVAGYPTVDLTTGGGDIKNGLTAPAFGTAFFAKDKNLAIEIWLQANTREYTDRFFVAERANWKQLVASFSVGAATKLVNGCF